MLAMLASLAMPMTAICVTMRMQVELWPFLVVGKKCYMTFEQAEESLEAAINIKQCPLNS